MVRVLKSLKNNKNNIDNKNKYQKIAYLKFIDKLNVSLDAKEVIYMNKINIPPIKIRNSE